MTTEQPTYSTRQKHALKSLLRSLEAARSRADRLLGMTRSRNGRGITAGITDLLGSLNTKLHDAAHHLSVTSTVLDDETRTHIAVCAESVNLLTERLINTIFSMGRRRLVETVENVSGRLMHACREVARCVSEIARKPRVRKSPVDDDIRRFLMQAGSRGWRICSMIDDEAAESPGPYEIGEALINDAMRPASELLDPDLPAGMVRFPVIVGNGNMARSASTLSSAADVGYSIRTVFGRYTLIPEMALLGVRMDTMETEDDDRPDDTVLDTGKFTSLVPYLRQQATWQDDILSLARPVLPAKRHHGHFYCPLIPNEMLRDVRFELGNWSVLIDRAAPAA